MRIFENEEFGKVRMVEIEGQPYFVGKDVATALGYANARKAVLTHVDEEDKGVTKWDTLGGMQEMTVINESGLYSLVLSSKLPSAKKFKRWVTTEVLPSIRKTGGDSEQPKGVVATPYQYSSGDMVDTNDSGQHGLVMVTEQNDEQVVSGRALHQFLEVETPYVKWFDRMCEYGFTEGTDFNLDKNVQVRLEGNREVKREITDHVLKLDMAKELCMLARSEKGKQARRYFLELEREWNSPEKVMARALKIAQQKLTVFGDRIKLLEADAERMRPKEIFADAVTGSSDTIPVGELAKILRQNGYRIGRNRLFDWMRENGYLIQRAGDSYNCPTQKAMDMGLFEIKETVVTHSDGTVSVYRTSKVTGKGQIYFVHKFSKGAWCA